MNNLPMGVSVGLIPARSGSKRVPNKNKRILGGLPLVSHTIAAAIESGIFAEIIVSTDDPEIAQISVECGAKVPSLRPSAISGDFSTDIEWLMYAVDHQISVLADYLAILRPTSPLRKAETIRNATLVLERNSWADSIRAMEVTDKHPGKMWILHENDEATPLQDQSLEVIPTHNRPTQTLPKVWVQNASLEVVRLTSLLETGSISGRRVMGFEMPGYEGFDLNTELDWKLLEILFLEQG
jgi:CMP-N,N'-diacetyllegionaminic acid synthase